MESLLDWLVRAEAISDFKRRRILGEEEEEREEEDVLSRLMEELRSGIALANLAAMLETTIRYYYY